MARDEKDYMTNPSLIQRVTSYITQGGRPEYQEATEHPKTLSVYNEPYAKQNGAALGTFEYYVDDDGRLTKGVADMGISDPFTKINSQIDMNVSLQAPKVKINGDKVVVQAPKEILSSPLVSQIKEELQPLKGADLKSEEVQNAIRALNEEVSTGLKNSLLNSATGWTRDQYNDYQYARQSVAGTNPMRSSNKIKGYDKDGNIIMKTPQEWVEYYRQFYNTDERTKAYEKSFYSSDPYERTMALVMGQGNKTPVYGFDTAEKMGEGWKAFVNQMGKFPEGMLRLLAEDNDTKRLDGIVNNKRIPVESMRKFNVNTEDEFNAKKDSIKGKSWDELSDDDKAFIAILGVSREGELEREADTTEAMKNYRGSRTNTFAWDTNRQDYERAERKAARQISTEDLNSAMSDDKEKSKDAIDRILSDNSFEKYRTARNNYDTWQGYQDWTEEGERELAETADWSGSEQWWGNLTGTIGRFLWENAVVKGATGGFAMNSISDKIAGSAELGTGIVGSLAKHGIAPTSRFGKNALQFTANLVGTIPEDILQTSVDNVLTYNIKDNTALLNPEQMSENFKNNLIFMAGFNALRAGMSTVKRALLAKQIAKAADLNEELVIGKFADADDVARAASKGQEVKVDGDKVSTVDVDGNETVLKNTTPEEANIAQQTIRPQEAAETVTTVTEEAIEPVKKKTKKEWKENPTYDQEYDVGRIEDVLDGRVPLSDYLEEQKERMWEAFKNSNQGTETFYHRDERGQIDRRETASYNGTLYRDLYAEYGGRPTKAEFGEAFDDVIKNGKDSKYYEGFKEFDADGDYSRGYNAGNTGIDMILALKGDVESAPAKTTSATGDGKINGAYTENTLLNKSKEIYDKKMARINKINDSAMRDSGAKAAGMEKAAIDRLITGKFTARELQNFYNRYEKNFKGKDVIVDGRSAKVANPSVYGKVKVEFEDGTTKVVDPSDISPKYTSAEDVRRDMWEKFVRPEIERELDVNLENGVVRSAEDTSEAPRIEVETARTKAEEPRAEAGTARAETEEPKTEIETTRTEVEEPKVTVEVDTPDGPVRTETADYTFRKIDDVTTPGVKIENTPAGVKHWHTKALDFVVNLAQGKLFREFRTRFGDITTSEFDWIFHNSKNGMTPEQIIGTVDPVSGKTITQNTIDAAKWWANNPIVQKLRMGSRKALGLEGDVNILGYLPHTNYDPANLSYDEALTGQLWREYTGKSTVGDDGKFTGYGGTFEDRFRTYASNMLWDIRGKEVAAAKLIEEAQMDGKNLTSEQAMKAVEGGQDIQAKVNDAPSTKALTKELSSDSEYDKKMYEDIDKKIKEEAPKSGLSKAYHDNYSDVYMGANGQAVQSQPDRIGSVSFNQQSDIMRNIKTRDGSMYDNGGADIVYASQNAVELVNRFTREGGDFREMLTEFIQNHSGRSPQYAEAVADRWISKMNDGPGKLTKGKAILSLSSSMRAEGMSRLRRWLVRAEYNGFNAKTRGFMDDFLFRHVQMDSIKNNRSIRGMASKALDGLTGMRYRALFYGNIKNALLQVSELSRLFTVFKWGDVGKTLKRLATDEGFRARVDTYIEAVSPQTTYLDSELYGKYQQVADSTKVDNDGITFKKLAGDAKDTADKIGLAPINAAENLKNRTMIAALVQEADRMGLSGDEALRHIRSRFERVALASGEMGRIGLASNPLAKPMLFLQNFQIRELGMHYYNIKDATGMTTSTPKRILEGSKYLTKVFGSKLATTLILARLGYSATQTLGIDPFGLTGNYTGLSEDEMNVIDKQISGGVLTPFFAGGMTSLIADMYFMARAAYEDSNRQTISDEVEANLEGSYGTDWSNVFSLDNAANLATGFVPGNTFFNRLTQMNEMMDTGWATSATGNKMYTAPDDTINTLLGYLFGRSATQNALQYNQTYGNDLGQTLSRTVGKTFADLGQALGIGSGYQQFDPIDTKNYSDWFNGDDNDRQQFEKGRRYFQQQRNRILDEYEEAIRKSYASNDDIAEAKNNMNQRLDSLYKQLDRFVSAYEKKNGTIDSAMTKQIVNILNTGRDVLGDTPEQAQERSLEEYNKALGRYSQRGFSPVGTYTGPTASDPDKEVKYQGSPQYRSAVQGYYGSADEAVGVLKQADTQLQPIRKELKQQLSNAYDLKDYDKVKELQQQYLSEFDQVVSPIIAAYGNSILKNTDVVNQLKDMLSTGTMSRSGDLIPSDQYRKDKYGRYRSMPMETVDVKKWAQQRFGGELYTQPTVNSGTTATEDLTEIRRLINQNQPQRARARAVQLKVRVDNQTRSLSPEDYQWLNDFLNGGQ